LTGEDLYQIAAIKFEEAAVTPEGAGTAASIEISPTTFATLRK
jgi:hypothetical protein